MHHAEDSRQPNAKQKNTNDTVATLQQQHLFLDTVMANIQATRDETV